MDVRVAVASHSLGSGFAGTMYSQLRKQVRPGYGIVECGVVMRRDTEFLRTRLIRLLETKPKPIALIGICLSPDQATLAAYREAGVPVVLIDEQAEGASTTASDSHAGGYMAADHLLGRGRRSIAVVAGELHTNGSYNAARRLEGFEQRLSEGRVPFGLDQVVPVVNYSRAEGFAALNELLARGRKIDAVFCAAGDVCATGILAAARERRIKVPGDLAVLGYDDNPLASISNPPLTTLRQPLDEISGHAWRLATQRTEQLLSKPEVVLVRPVLIERAST